jgi:fusion and transport protein UGO1
LLSPLDLVRTRLIVQSSHPAHKTYTGPIHALNSIIATEGGVRALYTHPSLLIPAILDNSVRPLLTLATPVFLYQYAGIEEDTHPLSYALASAACASAVMLVTLPIETVRRRMQVQLRGGHGHGHSGGALGLQACVELSPAPPYVGVLDTAWRIVREERSSPRRRRRRIVTRARRSSSTASTAAAGGMGGRRGSTASASAWASAKGKGKGKQRDDGVFDPALVVVDDEDDESLLEDDTWFASTGIAQLYRGFSMGLTANVVVFALGALATFTRNDSSSGWTEL